MERKYELIKSDKPGFYHPRALRDFCDITKGSVGGYIQGEDNLSQYGNAWVYCQAQVYGNAQVYDDAQVYGNAQVYGIAQVRGDALVSGDALVYGYAKVYDNAQVYGYAKVRGDAQVYGKAQVYGYAQVYDIAHVCGDAQVYGNALVCGNAVIKTFKDYIVFKNWWSSGRYFTWTRSNNMWSVGCFYNTGEELIEKAYRDSEESGREYERVVKYVESILKEP